MVEVSVQDKVLLVCQWLPLLGCFPAGSLFRVRQEWAIAPRVPRRIVLPTDRKAFADW